MKETIVVSVGGSLIVPDEINIVFLKKFKELILQQIKKGKRFVIICGGGKISRRYQGAASEILKLDNYELDLLGIAVTKLNASLMRTIFSDVTKTEIIENPNKKIDFDSVLFACGWKPGCSTDKDAILIAKTFGIKKVVNLTNVNYIYDKDPKLFKDAKPIKKTSWKEFRKILPKTWSPGLNSPFDPIAAKEAEKLGIEVSSLDGKDLDNFENYLESKEFIGSVVS